MAAAGWGVQLWDVSTATLLQTLGLGDDAPAAAAAGGAAPPSPHPYTCVSYVGELLAAGRQGEVVLLDPRVSTPVGRIHCGGPAVPRGGSAGGADGVAAEGGGGGLPATAGSGRVSLPGALSGVLDAGGGGAGVLGLGGAFASGLGAIAAAAAAAGAGAAGVGGGGRGAPCVGVQMDEWKLVCGFDDGRHQLHLYDIRSLSGLSGGGNGSGSGGGAAAAAAAAYGGAISFRRRPWSVPLMTFTAPARISSFQVGCGARARWFGGSCWLSGCSWQRPRHWHLGGGSQARASSIPFLPLTS